MPTINPIHLAYAVMVFAVIICYVLSKNQKKDLRGTANDFARAFVKLSNYISPNPPREELAVETGADDAVTALPLQEQPEAIGFIIKRANADKSVKLFQEMVESADALTKLAGINRTNKAQFSAPINELLAMTHTFLEGCEDLRRIQTAQQKAQFDRFLNDQLAHRMLLLRRISGDMAEEFRKLNQNYAAQMEALEQEELQKRRGGKQEEAPTPEAEPAQEKQEERKSDDWSGWGCG